MRRLSRGIALVAVATVATVAVAGGGLAAQQPPVRDRSAAPAAAASGTASIAGVVQTAGVEARAVPRVSVVLTRGTTSIPRVVVSDDQGAFRFDGLAEGSYMIAANKPGWIVQGGRLRVMGQEPSVPVAVRDGQVVTDVTLTLVKGGAIAGAVRYEGGQPGAGLVVQALRISTINGERMASMTAVPGQTDDRGQYRIFGLPPGQYVVQVQEQRVPSTVMTRQILPSEVRWAEAVAAQAGQAAEVATAPEPGPTVTYSRTYFPGTAYLSDAATIPIAAGDERLNVDIELRAVPTTTVTGTVLGVDGTPAAGARVTLTASGGGDDDLMSMMMRMLGAATGAATRPDGTFTIPGVAPGTYDLEVRAAPPQTGGVGPTPTAAPVMPAMARLMLGGGATTETLWARESIAVSGLPVGPIGLQLREGLIVSGTVVFDTAGTAPAPETIRVTLSPPSTQMAGLPDLPMLRVNPTVTQVAGDATFEVKGLMPGSYDLAVLMPGFRMNRTEAGTGWLIKSVRLGDRDLADVAVDVRGGTSLSGLVLTLTDRPSELTGRVLDQAGAPVSLFPVVIFSTDPALWRTGSRRVLAVQPATDGGFLVAGLPPGTYHLAAVTEVDPRELASPVFLESLIPAAITVTMGDGAHVRQDIRVQGGPPFLR